MSADNRRMDEWVALEQFDLSTVQVEQVDEPVGPGGRQVMGGAGGAMWLVLHCGPKQFTSSAVFSLNAQAEEEKGGRGA